MCLRKLCLLCEGRSSRVVGRDTRLGAPGMPRSEGWSWRGFWPSAGVAAFKGGFVPDDAALTLVIGLEPALALQSLVHDDAHCAFECPAPPRPAAGMALLWCRHGSVRAPGVQNGGDQPEHHAARHRSTPETHRKHRVIAWFLGDTRTTEALIPSVLDTSGPTTPINRSHQHAAPPKQPTPHT